MGSKSAWTMAIVLGLMAAEAPAQVSFQQNSYGLAIPPFGGYTPGAGATIGFGSAGNAFFEQNGFGQAVPPFGGFTPDAGATLSFGLPGGGINFSAAQGSRSSLSAQSVTGTLSNGVPMSVAESSLAPFVIGVIPVVGQGGASPLAERVARLRQGEQPGPRGGGAAPAPAVAVRPAAHAQAKPERKIAAQGGAAAAGPSSAERPARSVAEIRRAQQQSTASDDASSQVTAQKLVERAATATAAGKTSVARVYYQQALRHASGPLKQHVQQQLDALR